MSGNIRAGKGRALQRARLNQGRITETKRQKFLDTLAATCNVSLSAEAAGASRKGFYCLRARDAAFADAWQAAVAIGYHRLEEALLEYALSRIEAGEIDPERADPDAIGNSLAGKLSRRSVSADDLRFAVALLNRHRAMAEGRARGIRSTYRATAEETDAALCKQLDMLARQMKKHGV